MTKRQYDEDDEQGGTTAAAERRRREQQQQQAEQATQPVDAEQKPSTDDGTGTGTANQT